MIVRIVTLTFKPGTGKDFTDTFQHTKKQIREMRGCIFLELLQDKGNPDAFMTYSVWSSDADLERYRNSELFISTWSKIKGNFAQEAEARTMERIEKA